VGRIVVARLGECSILLIRISFTAPGKKRG
jgi:hypothetical protein